MGIKHVVIGVGVVAGLAAAAYAGTAYQLGKEIETKLSKGPAELLEQYPQLAVLEHSHERGVFSSQGRMVVGIDPECVGEDHPFLDGLRIAFVYRVQHGPVVGSFADGLDRARIEGSIEAEGKLKEQLKRLGINESLILARTRVDWDRTLVTELESPAWQVRNKHGNVIWHGAKGNATKRRGERTVSTLTLEAPGLELVAEQGTMLLSGIRLKSDSNYSDPRLSLGSFKFEVDRISGSMKGQATPLFQVNKLYFETEASANGALVDVALRAGIAEGKGPDGRWLKNAIYDIAFNRLHAATLIELSERFNEDLACGDPQGPQMQQSLQELSRIAMRLLEHEPQFEIKRAGLETAEGVLDIYFSLQFPPLKADEFSLPVLMERTNMEGRFRIPKAMAQQMRFPEAFGPMAQAVAQDGDVLVMNFKYAQGVIVVNGKAMDPALFMAGGQQQVPEPVIIEPAPVPALREQGEIRRY